jgi:hypothetical protein
VPILKFPVVWGADARQAYFRVLTVMAFPSDEESRKQHFAELVEASLKPREPGLDASRQARFAYLHSRLDLAEWNPSDLDGLKEILFNEMPPRLNGKSVGPQATENHGHGLLAGQVLGTVLHLAQRDKSRATIRRAKHLVAKELEQKYKWKSPVRPKPTVPGISIRSIENAWGAFKSVAHFYLAEILQKRFMLDTSRITSEAMEHFLATAESLRRRGEAYKPKGAKDPVLDPAENWCVDPLIYLPEVQISFPRLRPDQRRFLSTYKHI